jgi:hypothetical protein
MFDPQSFLDAQITDSLDTKVIPCPQGEFVGVIDKITPEQWKSGDGTKSGYKLSIDWLIEDQGVKDFLKRDTVKVKQQIFLDISDDGKLETGAQKNIGLGRLREAVGMNNAGQAFSFGMLPGSMAKVNVTHRPDPKDAENVFAEINKVAKQ